MMKRIAALAFMMLVLAALSPLRALAAGTVTDDIALDETTGAVTLSSSHAAGEGISSLQFSLTVEPTQADAQVTFRFEEGLAAPIQHAVYHADTHQLNLYLVGVAPLLDGGETQLPLGTLEVTGPAGERVAAQVSTVEDSLKYVYGMDVRPQPLDNGFTKTLNGETPDDPTAPGEAEPDTDDSTTPAAPGESTPAADDGTTPAAPGETEPDAGTTTPAVTQETPAADGEAADTGDHTPVALWTIVFTVSGLVAVTLILAMVKRRRGHYDW